MSKKGDHFFIDSTHSACYVIDLCATQNINQTTEKIDSKTAKSGRLEALLPDKTRANGNIRIACNNGRNQILQIRCAMLPISIKLDRDIVIVFLRISIARLNATANTKIYRKIQKICTFLF